MPIGYWTPRVGHVTEFRSSKNCQYATATGIYHFFIYFNLYILIASNFTVVFLCKLRIFQYHSHNIWNDHLHAIVIYFDIPYIFLIGQICPFCHFSEKIKRNLAEQTILLNILSSVYFQSNLWQSQIRVQQSRNVLQ